jgi:dienelactone hydrolase
MTRTASTRFQCLSTIVLAAASALVTGCPYSEQGVFNEWSPNVFSEPPAELGPYQWVQYQREFPDGADGQPLEITVVAPVNAAGPLPLMCWVTGSNQVVHYHQSLHETLASWGYAVIVPTTRPLLFEDTAYHRRNVDLCVQSIRRALSGALGMTVDETRIATGGHSIGATMALLVAGEELKVDAVVLWAPTASPFWQGLDPFPILLDVSQPVYYLLAELDWLALNWPDTLQRASPNAPYTQHVVPGGNHLFFQQPTEADVIPEVPWIHPTRFEQQTIAIERTRAWLDDTLQIAR